MDVHFEMRDGFSLRYDNRFLNIAETIPIAIFCRFRFNQFIIFFILSISFIFILQTTANFALKITKSVIDENIYNLLKVSHIHSIIIEQELFDADVEDTVIIVPGDDIVFNYYNLLKGIADAL